MAKEEGKGGRGERERGETEGGREGERERERLTFHFVPTRPPFHWMVPSILRVVNVFQSIRK